MWSHGGRLVDEHNQPAIRSAETAAALAYAQEIYPTLVPGTAGWNDASNNKAFLAGDVSLTNNAVSIYGKTRADKMAIADDIDHANFPVGPVGVPTEMHLLYPLMVFSYTKYPDAARAFITFMMEAPQYNALLERSIGYITQTLKAYEANPVWTSDPKTSALQELLGAGPLDRLCRHARLPGRLGPRRFRGRRHVRRGGDGPVEPRGRNGPGRDADRALLQGLMPRRGGA